MTEDTAEPQPTELNGTSKPQHIVNLLDMVRKLDDADALAGVVVVMAGKDGAFRVLSANNSEWSREKMVLAVKQAIRQKPDVQMPQKKFILPN